VVGIVGIDGLAGPTELVIVADETAPVGFVAADLRAQAEHDPLAWGTLVTTSPSLAETLPDVPQSRVLLVRDLGQAVQVANQLAPEHLQLMVEDPEACLPLIRNAGAVFLGPWSAVAFGDYGVGSNHVLPTMGTARFASGLRTSTFLKVSAVVEVTAQAAEGLSSEVALIARAEGLQGHANAVEVRTAEEGGYR
jgi:histidinol dehydrogenase